MKRLLSLFSLLLLLHTAQAQGNAQAVKDWERAKAYTAEYIAAMPEDGMAYKPSADVRSFAEQMLHIAGANFMFAAQASGKANPYQGKDLEKMDNLKSKAELQRIVNESYDYVTAAVKGMQPAQASESFKLFNMDITREQAFAKAFEHGAHHRGQTTIYLRMKGVKPPQEKLF
jgi:uncharacterized damage-inducible protein DinB